MHEARRQAYLQAMGVISYEPRFVLPGAAASALRVVQVAQQAQQHAPLATPDNIDKAPAPAPADADLAAYEAMGYGELAGADDDAADLAQQQGAQQQGQPAPAAAPSALVVPPLSALDAAKPESASRPAANPAGSGQREEIAHFSAELVHCSCGLLFISPVSLQRADKALVKNIAIAYTRHHGLPAELEFNAGRFQWPPGRSPGLEMGPDAARDAFSGRLLAGAERQSVRLAVVFGGEALQPYLDQNLLASAGLNLVFAPALSALASSASDKAALWQALRQVAATPPSPADAAP